MSSDKSTQPGTQTLWFGLQRRSRPVHRMGDLRTRLVIFLAEDLCGTLKCAPRRTITDITTGLYRAAIRRLPITEHNAARASVAVVCSGTAAEAESEAPMP